MRVRFLLNVRGPNWTQTGHGTVWVQFRLTTAPIPNFDPVKEEADVKKKTLFFFKDSVANLSYNLHAS